MGKSQVLPRCALWTYHGRRTVQDGALVVEERPRAQRTSPLGTSRVSYQQDFCNVKADHRSVGCIPLHVLRYAIGNFLSDQRKRGPHVDTE